MGVQKFFRKLMAPGFINEDGTPYNPGAGQFVPLAGGTMTGPLLVDQNVAGMKMRLAMKLPGVQQDAPTAFGIASTYLGIGGGEWNANSYRLIGFGYIAAAGNQYPAVIGYEETSISSNTHGDLVFGTRPGNGNDAPPVVMRIRSDGQILAENVAYAPTAANSLAPKGYVDTEFAKAIPLTQKGAVGGVATLDGGGKIPQAQLPPLEHDSAEAATEAAMLALAVTAPAICIRTDFNPPHIFYLANDPASTLANWHDVGAFSAAAAAPTSPIGLAAVPGVAATYMRSDAAPALSQTIIPQWSAMHTFVAAGSATESTVRLGGLNPYLEWFDNGAPADEKKWIMRRPAATTFALSAFNDNGNQIRDAYLVTRAGYEIARHDFLANNAIKLSVTATDILAGAAYAPANALSLTTKAYVDTGDTRVPTNTVRGGVLQQAAIADLTGPPDDTDFNALLAALRSSGLLAA